MQSPFAINKTRHSAEARAQNEDDTQRGIRTMGKTKGTANALHQDAECLYAGVEEVGLFHTL